MARRETSRPLLPRVTRCIAASSPAQALQPVRASALSTAIDAGLDRRADRPGGPAGCRPTGSSLFRPGCARPGPGRRRGHRRAVVRAVDEEPDVLRGGLEEAGVVHHRAPGADGAPQLAHRTCSWVLVSALEEGPGRVPARRRRAAQPAPPPAATSCRRPLPRPRAGVHRHVPGELVPMSRRRLPIPAGALSWMATCPPWKLAPWGSACGHTRWRWMGSCMNCSPSTAGAWSSVQTRRCSSITSPPLLHTQTAHLRMLRPVLKPHCAPSGLVRRRAASRKASQVQSGLFQSAGGGLRPSFSKAVTL